MMNILITDDEKFMHEDLQKAVERVHPGNTYFFAENFDSAVGVVRENEIDVAFLDINMPGKSGLELAKEIKDLRPAINIIIVTAYAEYALNALRLYVSGFILKPVMDSELKEALDHLRVPVIEKESDKKLTVKCFGNFAVYCNGKAVSFFRQKGKELLAYLICLNGAAASRGELCANLFEGSSESKGLERLKKAVQSLKKDLDKYGMSEVLIHSRNAYAVNTDLINCDYYDYLSRKPGSKDSYQGQFMSQYSWAEVYIYALEEY
jgi:two-component SAPR family response regulator